MLATATVIVLLMAIVAVVKQVGYAVKVETRAIDTEGPDQIVDQLNIATLSSGQAVLPMIVIPDQATRAACDALYSQYRHGIDLLLAELKTETLNKSMVMDSLLAHLSALPRTVKTEATALIPLRTAPRLEGRQADVEDFYGTTKETHRPFITDGERWWVSFQTVVDYENPWYIYVLEAALESIYPDYLSLAETRNLRLAKTQAKMGSDELLVQMTKPEFTWILNQKYIDSQMAALYADEGFTARWDGRLESGMSIGEDIVLAAMRRDYMRELVTQNAGMIAQSHKFSLNQDSLTNLRKFHRIYSAMIKAFAGMPSRIKTFPLAKILYTRSAAQFWSLVMQPAWFWPWYEKKEMGLQINGWEFNVAETVTFGERKERYLNCTPQEAGRLVTIFDWEIWKPSLREQIDAVHQECYAASQLKCQARFLHSHSIHDVGHIIPLNSAAINPMTAEQFWGEMCVRVTNWDKQVGEVILSKEELDHYLQYQLYGAGPASVAPVVIL